MGYCSGLLSGMGLLESVPDVISRHIDLALSERCLEIFFQLLIVVPEISMEAYA